MAQEISASIGMTIDLDLRNLNDYDTEERMGLYRLTLRRSDVKPDPAQ